MGCVTPLERFSSGGAVMHAVLGYGSIIPLTYESVIALDIQTIHLASMQLS